MNEKLRDRTVDRLFATILELRDAEECYAFFEDLCTIAEIKAMAQRLEVAELLNSGMTYADISASTGASTATISRVNRALHYGADGYRKLMERFGEKERT